MLLVASDPEDGIYSNWIEPPRAPTTRSVPETLAKLLRSARMRSTPSNKVTLTAIAMIVKIAVAFRFHRLFA